MKKFLKLQWSALKKWSIKNKVIAVMAVIIFILLLKLEYCSPKVQYLDRHFTDSIIVKSKRDTIYRTIKVNKYVTIDKEPIIIRTIKDTCFDLQEKDYIQDVSDSLISGKITARVLGNLQSLKLDYDVCIPTVYQTDSVFSYRTITKYKQPVSLMVGGAIGGNQNTFVAGINLGLITPKGMVYETQYDFSGKTITFGVKKAFKLQK